jgi:hypothetical protein
MNRKMSKQSKRELLDALRPKYKCSSPEEKLELLNVFVESTGFHRKYAIAQLNSESQPRERKRRVVKYDEELKSALIKIWKSMNEPASKRMVPFIPEFLDVMERTGNLRLSPDTRDLLCSISPATVDRILKPLRATGVRSLSYTKPGNLLKKQIPLRTFTEWSDAVPGFFEADLVAHSGPDPSGQFLQTLTLTDISTQWTECFALLRRGEVEVRMALQDREQLLPFPFKGLDTDNGFEFINWNMLKWCKLRGITFTRGRPNKKNDQAHVEERNGAIVRKLVGYDRLEGRMAHRVLTEFYEVVRLYQNFFQPSQKLLEKHRNGAKVHKKHDKARTPYQRILESTQVSESAKAVLTEKYQTLDPVELMNRMREIQARLEKLATPCLYPQSKLARPRKSKPSLDATLVLPKLAQQKKSVSEMIRALPPGCEFQALDFLSYASRAAVDMTLTRMTRQCEIERIGHGVYKIPGETSTEIPLMSKKIDEAMESVG